MTRGDEFFQQLGFEADPFQREAIGAIETGESVVVTAPTGAGKTLVADGAIFLALKRGKRSFYTTPIKALSNQKFADLSQEHGEHRVGLLTGDNSINGDADIVVMTTEVFRNMIYGGDDRLSEVGVVILDEVHYLADISRGSVWEEVIIHAPDHIQFVCLSATVANPEEFTDWISARRGPTRLVVETNRPVPLEPMYMITDLWSKPPVQMFDLFVKDRPNPRIQHLLAARTGKRRRFATPRRVEVVEELARRSMLPTIMFIFSRAGCEAAAHMIAGSALDLTTSDERLRIRQIALEATEHLEPEDLDTLGFGRWLADLERGVGAHHAGLVPAFKEVVERLFEGGLLKVVCATETLALGINMPARSVVIESITKYNGESHEMLTASDYTQLTGRAGRRGIDEVGFGISLYSRFVRFERMAEIVGRGATRLVSSFRPTYNMAVNLVANYDQSNAELLLEASFAQFQLHGQVAQDEERLIALRRDVEQARFLAACDKGDVWSYLEALDSHVPAMTEAMRAGDVFEVRRGGRQGRYLVLSAGDGKGESVVALSSGGKVRNMTGSELAGAILLGQLDFTGPFRPSDRKFQQRATQRLRSFQSSAGRTLAADVDHPVAACGDADDHVSEGRRALKLQRKIDKSGGANRGSLVHEFRSILSVLGELGYVSEWSLTADGERLRTIYGSRDLLVAESIRTGLLDDLSSADLAAAASAFMYEPRATDEAVPVPLALDEFAANVSRLAEHLTFIEETFGVRLSPPPEFGFMEAAYHWAQGLELDEILDGLTMAPGDFVRQVRQLIDQLRQIRDGAPHLARVVNEALSKLDRGVVAAQGVS